MNLTRGRLGPPRIELLSELHSTRAECTLSLRMSDMRRGRCGLYFFGRNSVWYDPAWPVVAVIRAIFRAPWVEISSIILPLSAAARAEDLDPWLVLFSSLGR